MAKQLQNKEIREILSFKHANKNISSLRVNMFFNYYDQYYIYAVRYKLEKETRHAVISANNWGSEVKRTSKKDDDVAMFFESGVKSLLETGEIKWSD